MRDLLLLKYDLEFLYVNLPLYYHKLMIIFFVGLLKFSYLYAGLRHSLSCLLSHSLHTGDIVGLSALAKT